MHWNKFRSLFRWIVSVAGVLLASALGRADTPAPLALGEVRTWAYQIQDLDQPGAVEALANSAYDLLVVEPTRTEKGSQFDTPAMVRRLQSGRSGDRRHRKVVLAYLSIGEAEDWRWYWSWPKKWRRNRPRPKNVPDFILQPDADGWNGCFVVAYWAPAWKDILLAGEKLPPTAERSYRSALDEVVSSGFDGVYLDWVEAYDVDVVRRAAKLAGVDPAQEMIKLLGEIRAYGRRTNPNFIVIQQNAAELLEGHPELLKVVDAIAQEEIWFAGKADRDWNDPGGYDQPTPEHDRREYLRLLGNYRAAHKPVLTVDYTLAHASATYRQSRAAGFVPYCTRVALSRLTTTMPFDP